MTTLATVIVLSVLSAGVLPRMAIGKDLPADAKATEQRPIDPKTAQLGIAVQDFVALLEQDDAGPGVATAAERWAKDDDAAKQIKENWDRLKEAHAEFNYRRWVNEEPFGAKYLPKETKSFTVGGHEFCHLHTQWEKTPDGWRVARVFMCR